MNSHAQRLYNERRAEYDGMSYADLTTVREQLMTGLQGDTLNADERDAGMQLLVAANELMTDTHDDSDPLADARAALAANPHSRYQQELVNNLENSVIGIHPELEMSEEVQASLDAVRHIEVAPDEGDDEYL